MSPYAFESFLNATAATGESAHSHQHDLNHDYFHQKYLRVYLATLILGPVHFGFLLAIFYRTYVIVRRRQKRLALSQRIPFYIAVGESFIMASFLLTALHSLVYGHNLHLRACSVIGASFSFFAAFEYCLMPLLAIFTYARVCRHWSVRWGKHDWILLVISLGLPAFGVTLAASRGYFGSTGLFLCFIDDTNPAISILARLGITAVVFGIAITTGFCLPVLRVIWRTSKDLDKVLAVRVQGDRLVLAQTDVNNAAWRITLYIVIYSVKSIAGVPLYKPLLEGPGTRIPPSFIILIFVSFHLGGIINGFHYLLCDGCLPTWITLPFEKRRAQRQMQLFVAAGWDAETSWDAKSAQSGGLRSDQSSISLPFWTGTTNPKVTPPAPSVKSGTRSHCRGRELLRKKPVQIHASPSSKPRSSSMASPHRPSLLISRPDNYPSSSLPPSSRSRSSSQQPEVPYSVLRTPSPIPIPLSPPPPSERRPSSSSS
ncbi:hypothetical protein DFS34DRAFT_616632 [Phlyctochytrium arcticum]|nr:hypothetical protein DFS34DRAFT_616632 [Phlyctochytrium arcticum]